MKISRLIVMAVSVLVVGTLIGPLSVLAQDTAQDFAKRALQECTQGRVAKGREARLAHFQHGQALGEQAVALDEVSPEAHFSLFCNLGELLRVDGESLTSVFGLRRMMRELDRALELNPDYIDALSAKGTLLVKLPSFLGGDIEKGEALLERVVRQAPKAVNARLSLAKVRCERGRHQEAVALATDALALAQKHNRADFIPEARAVLEQLQANADKVGHKRNSDSAVTSVLTGR
jgi:tetratricopeptide (TPR) repeat protein